MKFWYPLYLAPCLAYGKCSPWLFYLMLHCEGGRGLDRVSNEEARSPGFVLSLELILAITQHLETLTSRELGERQNTLWWVSVGTVKSVS